MSWLMSGQMNRSTLRHQRGRLYAAEKKMHRTALQQKPLWKKQLSRFLTVGGWEGWITTYTSGKYAGQPHMINFVRWILSQAKSMQTSETLCGDKKGDRVKTLCFLEQHFSDATLAFI
mmetsp:Transcript_8527/g.21044  ORF Transcript_8527/g.21044 Transcript_8527/m.21044 type:complete len:118 (-) Transcript_8527:187-540(-)